MNIPPKSSSSMPPAAGASLNTYSNVNGLEALKKDPHSPEALHAVAQQIDAMFLQMMLKSMRDAGAEIGEGDSNAMGMYQDMFDKQIALTLSQRQDLGLGSQLTRQLSNAAAAATPPTAGVLPGASVEPKANAALTAALAAAGYLDGDQVSAADGVNPDAAAGESVDSDAGARYAVDAAGPAAGAADPIEFVNEVFPSIQRAAQALGVSPFAMLAQAALETGWGKRMPRSADGTSSLNLFGIKADDKWTGGRVAADTVEFSGGVASIRRTAFRAYQSIDASVHDFAQLLAYSPRYRDAVSGGGDIRAYVEAMGRSGYATDPDYANKLKSILNSSTFRVALGARRAFL